MLRRKINRAIQISVMDGLRTAGRLAPIAAPIAVVIVP